MESTTILPFIMLAIVLSSSWADGNTTIALPTKTDAITTEGFENMTQDFRTQISDILVSTTGNMKDKVELVEETAATDDIDYIKEEIIETYATDSVPTTSLETTIFETTTFETTTSETTTFETTTFETTPFETTTFETTTMAQDDDIEHRQPSDLNADHWKIKEYLLGLVFTSCLILFAGSWVHTYHKYRTANGQSWCGARFIAYFRRSGRNARGSPGKEIELDYTYDPIYKPTTSRVKRLGKAHKSFKASKTTLAEDGPKPLNGGTSPPFSSVPLLDDFQLDFNPAEPLPSTSNAEESAFLVPKSRNPSAD